jgi:alanine dehydrogenase
MKVGIPKEIYPHERRVAAVPETVHKIRKLGYEVLVEAGAGDAAAFADGTYAEAGASVVPDAVALYAAADIVLKVRQPIATAGGAHEADLLKEGATLISFIWPAQNKELIDRLAARKVTVLAMDAMPRITRANFAALLPLSVTTRFFADLVPRFSVGDGVTIFNQRFRPFTWAVANPVANALLPPSSADGDRSSIFSFAISAQSAGQGKLV